MVSQCSLMPGCRVGLRRSAPTYIRENGSALEVVLHDYALYKFTFTLLYFTIRNLEVMVESLSGGRRPEIQEENV